MPNIETIKADVLAIGLDMTPDQVCEVWTRVENAKAAARELGQLLEGAIIEWIEANGDLTIGDQRYYVGTERKVTCTDNAGTMDAVLFAGGGEEAALLECLSSQPWKHGAVRGLIGDDDFNRLFKTEVRPDLKTGKPKKVVKRALT